MNELDRNLADPPGPSPAEDNLRRSRGGVGAKRPEARPEVWVRVVGQRWLLALLALLTTATAECRAQERGVGPDLEAREERAFKEAAAIVAPSLVRIETVGGLERVDQILTGTGPTTGVVVTEDGYIVSSAFNFVARPASILVTLADGRRLPAVQVAMDRVKMLALLKVEAQGLIPPQVAPRESIRVGQWALALGKTLDETPSLSVGIVSALGRIWGKAIQTDAKISPVNWGGALADAEGRVLGVLVPLSPQASGEVAGVEWYDSGIGFAIPLVDIYAALDRLKLGQDLYPGLMGITMQGQSLYEGQPRIDRVRYGSPAQQAGLKEQDLIVELEGRPIARQAQLKHVLGNKYAGESIAVKVRRGTQELTRELTLIDRLTPYESAYLGVLPVRPEAKTPPLPGVAVRYVFPDSPAAIAGIERGERIVRFNDQELAGVAALLDQVSRQRPGEKARLTIVAADGNRATREVEVNLGSLPTTVPSDLRPAAMAPRDKELPDKSLPLGRITEKMPAHEHEYWAYVPDDYNPDYKYGLLVWLHPGGDTMEGALAKAWQTHCAERGIILLAPKARQLMGWTPDETEFVKDAVEEFQKKYSIDPSRIVLHAFGTSGAFAYQTAFKHRALFHGVATIAAPMPAPPPDNEPDFRLQLYLCSGDNDPLHRGVLQTAKGLRDMKYPVVQTTIPEGGHKYPTAETVQEIAAWIDLLDRI
ncbi:MAG: PDZ domain-containing protein [Planctomycetales bacterium]